MLSIRTSTVKIALLGMVVVLSPPKGTRQKLFRFREPVPRVQTPPPERPNVLEPTSLASVSHRPPSRRPWVKLGAAISRCAAVADPLLRAFPNRESWPRARFLRDRARGSHKSHQRPCLSHCNGHRQLSHHQTTVDCRCVPLSAPADRAAPGCARRAAWSPCRLPSATACG